MTDPDEPCARPDRPLGGPTLTLVASDPLFTCDPDVLWRDVTM